MHTKLALLFAPRAHALTIEMAPSAPRAPRVASFSDRGEWVRVLGTPNICHVLTSHWPSLPVPRPSFSPPLLRYRSVHVRSRGEGKGSRAVMGGWYVGFVMVDSLTPMFFCPLTPVGGTAPSVRLESHRGLESCPSLSPIGEGCHANKASSDDNDKSLG